MIAFDDAVAEIENHEGLASLREVRANVLSEATTVATQLQANDGWRNPDAAEADAKRILKAVSDYNAAVRKTGLALALHGASHPVARKALDNLRIGFPAFNPASLYRTIGRRGDERAKEKRQARLDYIREQRPGHVFKLATRDAATAVALIGNYPPAIDVNRRAARFLINSSDVDRQGEVIEPLGVDQSDFVLNPIVQFEHGQSPEGGLPIGKSVRSDGKPGVDVSAEGVSAWVEFGIHPFAETVWKMVLRGELSAASIHVSPVAWEDRYIDGMRVRAYTNSKLIEWSVVSIPANPSAVLKHRAKPVVRRTKAKQAADEQEWLDRVIRWKKIQATPDPLSPVLRASD